MAAEKVKNLAASIRQRLLNLAKERGDTFDLVLARYALERLLYRLGASPHGERPEKSTVRLSIAAIDWTRRTTR